MVTADLVLIELEVRVVDESQVGLARVADGATREFAGWLGLMTTLAALLPAQAEEPGTDRHQERRGRHALELSERAGSAFGARRVSAPKRKLMQDVAGQRLSGNGTTSGRLARAWSGSAKLACRSRMIVPMRPDASSPGPSGPDVFSPTGGSCRRAALADADIQPSCQQTSSLTASGRSGAASPDALAAYAAAPKACPPI